LNACITIQFVSQVILDLFSDIVDEYAFLINTTSSNCIKRIQCGRATRVVAIRDHAFFVANSNFYSCSQTDIQLTEPDVVDFTCSNRVCLLLKTNGDVVTIRGRNRHGRTVHKWFIYPLRKSRLEFANPFPNYHIKQIQNFERGLMLITRTYSSETNIERRWKIVLCIKD
jgi:hypothetical protein